MLFQVFTDMIEFRNEQNKKALCENEQAVLEFIQGRRKTNVKLRRRVGKVSAEFGN